MLEVQDTDPDRGGRLGRFIRNLEYLYKWLLLGIIIGVVAGLGAVIFYLALRYTSSFLLGYVAGYHMPTPLVEGGRPGSSHYQRPWALPLVTTAGALVSALIVAKFAPEASGHGTDNAIEAIHTDPRHIRGRVVLVKMIASALTIGSGGSAGREGPTAQISAGFASMLARRLHLSDADGRILVSLGVGAGIGAIFGAPLGGAVLAASIIYREDLDTGRSTPASSPRRRLMPCSARFWASTRCSATSTPSTASRTPGRCCGSSSWASSPRPWVICTRASSMPPKR